MTSESLLQKLTLIIKFEKSFQPILMTRFPTWIYLLPLYTMRKRDFFVELELAHSIHNILLLFYEFLVQFSSLCKNYVGAKKSYVLWMDECPRIFLVKRVEHWCKCCTVLVPIHLTNTRGRKDEDKTSKLKLRELSILLSH